MEPYIATIIGFTIGNFIVQLFKKKPDYKFAMNISIYQIAPVVFLYIIKG